VSDEFFKDHERRRSPRFLCGGHARLVCLPSEGELHLGKLHDLSLNGCAIETGSQLECGARTELLVRVNASSFRAVGQVRAMRVPFGIGVEFLHLTSTGQDMLAELVRELARQRALARMLRAARLGTGAAELNRQQEFMLEQSRLVLGEILSPNDPQALEFAVKPQALIVDGEVDLLI
jgi:hypothetical protein